MLYDALIKTTSNSCGSWYYQVWSAEFEKESDFRMWANVQCALVGDLDDTGFTYVVVSVDPSGTYDEMGLLGEMHSKDE